MRCVQTKFWDDGYSTKLDPTEKLLFLYFLTNPLTNISGIYEIQFRRIAFDTGLSEETIKEILTRFERDKKIYHIDDWIIIKNFIKNQNLNPSTAKGVKNEIESVPKDIWLKINKIKALQTVCRQAVTDCDNIIKSNLIKYNRIKRSFSFSLSDFVNKYRKSKERHLNILAEYADEKKLKFETSDQWDNFILRNAEDANKLVSYSDKQISDAMSKVNNAKEKYLKNWSLKTLNKFLDQ